ARACFLLEEDAGEMAGGADAGNARGRLARVGLEPGDQLLQVVRRKAFPAADQERLGCELRDRLQVVAQIERERVESADQDMRAQGADAERVAVRGRTHRPADTYAAGCAGD